MDKEKKKIMATSYEKKQKKKMIMMASVLGVLVIAFAAFMIATGMNKSEEEEMGEESYTLVDVGKSDIVGVTYSYILGEEEEEKENVNVSFKHKDDKWYFADDDKLPISQQTFTSNVVNSIVTMAAGRKIEKPKDINQYGIDKDIFNMVIELKDGSNIELTAGKYNETMGGFYIQKSGDSAIYLMGGDVSETMYDLFRPDVYEYATMDVMPTVTIDILQFIGIYNGKAEVELTYKPDGVEYDLINSSHWYFQAPFSRLMGTVDDKIESCVEIITAIKYYKLADYDATDEELVKYGIEGTDKFYSMSYYMDIKGDNGETTKELYTFKLEIGGLDKSGQYYYVRPVLTNGTYTDVSRKVSCVEKGLIDELIGIDALDYVYRMASYVPFDNMVGGYMEITTPDGNYKVDVAEKVEQLEDGQTKDYKIFTVNGKELASDKAAFVTSFYSKYMTSLFKQIIYDDTLIKEVKPVYTIEYTLVDQPFEKQIVQYTEYDKVFYQVTVDGYTDVLVTREEIDAAFAELANLK